MSLRILFMGSDAFAVPAVRALHASSHRLMACVTQPDRPQGRGRGLRACPVNATAAALGVPTLTPERIADAADQIAALAPDLTVVAAYGQYIPRSIISCPRLGTINIHPSLLPRYRGAAPIQWAVANGDTETGVTILDVIPRMDAGPILLQERHPIYDEDTTLTLEPRLAELGATLVLQAIEQLESGVAVRRPQDEAAVTWARKLVKTDGALDWSQPARALHNRVRGFQPWPGTYGIVWGRRLNILATRMETAHGAPGTILDLGRDGPLIACGADALRLLIVQPEGRRAMPGADYARGARLSIGQSFAMA